jgi:hypothetical protein
MAKGKTTEAGAATGIALDTLDGIEPELRHLHGLITACTILGEADDSIEPVAIASLARCAREALKEIELNWRTAISALRMK